MIRIRLARYGRKNAPSYRIVAADKRSKRNGKYIEKLGFFNPIEGTQELNKERFDELVKLGAQPSEAVLKIVDGTYKHIPYNPKDTGAEENEEETKEETKEE